MRRLWPTSLISQMILILLAGLVASHLIAAWIYASDRTRAVRAIGGYAAAQRIANLARLELQPDESERMLTQINGFFGIVEAMQAVDTTGIEPMAHPVAAIQDITLRLRPDVVSEPNQRDLNQRSAPAVERGLFLVPKVIE